MRALVISAGAIFTAASSWGQAIQFINVTRQANYVQTDASTVSAAPTTPFIFRAAVEGDNATTGSSPLTAATFTPPGGSATALTYNASGHRWMWEDSTQTSMSNLNTAYGTGSYSFNLTGTPSGTDAVTVGSFAATQLQVPQLTLSGGSGWVGNSYQMTAGSTLTIAFNAVYSGTVGGTASFHYDAEINGPSYSSVDDFINYNPQTSSAATYASTPPNFVVGSLAAGSYTVNVSFDDIQNPANLYSGSVFGASLLEYRTTLSVTVIPEPATEVGLFGALALAGVLLSRRRRTA